MNIILNIETQIHLTKHFYFLDENYKELLADNGINKFETNNLLTKNSSKFLKSFATNPLDLKDKIASRLSEENLQEGKNDISLYFKEIIGFDLLIHNSSKANDYSTTRKLNIILVKEKEELNIITIFPGRFAPALPNKETQNNDIYNISKLFWEDYKLSSFSNFEIVEYNILNILSTVNKSWDLKYTNQNEALKLASEANKIADEIRFHEGRKLAQLAIISAQLVKITANEDSFKILTKLLSDFDKYSNCLAATRTIITLSNQYDLFGMYSKGIEICIKGIKLAKENNYLPELSDLHSTFGFINIRISDFNQAEKSFGKSLQIRTELQNKPAIAASYNQLARASMLNKKYNKAEEYYIESITIRKENEYYAALLWSYIGIASLYMEIKEYDKTLAYFQKIEELKTKHNLSDKRSTIMCLHGEGQIKNNLEKFEDAKTPLIKSLQIAEELGVKPIQYQIHLELYKSYRNLKNNGKALYHFEKYHEIKETVLNEENSNKLKQQQISFAVEKSEKEAEIERLKNVELKKANNEITKQKEEIEEIHNEISDSINYAQKIQETVLPTTNILKEYLSDFFVLFKPKDKVSGDFYWWANVGERTIITAADCTGHGVPGAFMSMLGVSLLREIVVKEKIVNTSNILDELRTHIIKALKQTGESGTQKDGMDMAIISINNETNIVQFSGANNSLYIIKNNELQITNKNINSVKLIDNSKLKINSSKMFYEVKPNKMPIAIYEKMDNFTTHEFQLEKGDQLYMFSDGYADQFGGPKGKKFKYKPFKRLLLENADKTMLEQKNSLNTAFEDWKKTTEQIDDVVLIGIKL